MLKTGFSLLVLFTPLIAAEFKSEKECVVGSKVADRQNQTGKVIAVEPSTCRVRLDGSGKTIPYLFWMLHAAGDSVETNDKLVIGKYDCWVGSQAAGEMRITGPSTYESDGKKGTFRVEPSRKIVFESGPFSTFNAKLLAGPRIGMNMEWRHVLQHDLRPGEIENQTHAVAMRSRLPVAHARSARQN